VFWIVWIASAFSLVAILWVPSIAEMFRVTMPNATQTMAAALVGVVAVAWRLVPFGADC